MKKKKNLKSIFDRLSDKTSFTGVSKQRHLNQQGNEATSDGNSGVNVKIIEVKDDKIRFRCQRPSWKDRIKPFNVF